MVPLIGTFARSIQLLLFRKFGSDFNWLTRHIEKCCSMLKTSVARHLFAYLKIGWDGMPEGKPSEIEQFRQHVCHCVTSVQHTLIRSYTRPASVPGKCWWWLRRFWPHIPRRRREWGSRKTCSSHSASSRRSRRLWKKHNYCFTGLTAA